MKGRLPFTVNAALLSLAPKAKHSRALMYHNGCTTWRAGGKAYNAVPLRYPPSIARMVVQNKRPLELVEDCDSL